MWGRSSLEPRRRRVGELLRGDHEVRDDEAAVRDGVRDGVRGRDRVGGRLSSPRRQPTPKGLGEGFGLGLECAGWRAGKKRASAVMLVKGARF